MSNRILIAPAGWEDRYLQGVRMDIDQFQPTLILIPYSASYKDRTRGIREEIKSYSSQLGIAYQEAEVDYCDAVEQYRSILLFVATHFQTASAVRLNATTTPRDLIWNILHFLEDRRMPTEFSYYRPTDYGDYLSRDAQSPRLVLKRSGITFPDRPTCILVLDGFDTERRAQLRNRYEPKIMLVGRQIGEQLGNVARNASNLLEPCPDEVYFNFDCYDTSVSSLDLLGAQLSSLGDEFNVIAASLGPKPSALTLFNLVRKRPDIGLVYIPAGDYSEKYSSGIDKSNVLVSEISW